ncbi:MAG: cyclase family protein [Candidatus Andersenbacteria bacterium]
MIDSSTRASSALQGKDKRSESTPKQTTVLKDRGAEWVDITRPINERLAIYPGNPPVHLTPHAQASATSSALTQIILGSHTGTHIDAPAHITPRGHGTAMYSLEQLCGRCVVIDLTATADTIVAADIPPVAGERVLFKTSNSAGSLEIFDPDFVALAESAAKELVARGVKLVGIDGPSVKKRGVRDTVHKMLLDAGIIIIEGLWLAEVEAGDYELLCLPLAVDLDGAPVRAVLTPLETRPSPKASARRARASP